MKYRYLIYLTAIVKFMLQNWDFMFKISHIYSESRTVFSIIVMLWNRNTTQLWEEADPSYLTWERLGIPQEEPRWGMSGFPSWICGVNRGNTWGWGLEPCWGSSSDKGDAAPPVGLVYLCGNFNLLKFSHICLSKRFACSSLQDCSFLVHLKQFWVLL